MRNRVRSFGYAFRGIRLLLGTQANARIHLLATVGVVFLGLLFGISAVDWCLVICAASMVWAAEALNSALELLADYSAPKWHPLIERAKDVAAGGVLLTAIGALIIGVIVFLPHVKNGL